MASGASAIRNELRPARRPLLQERFLRFAFTAADLLLELGQDAAIKYAAGAFGTRLGAPAEEFLGQNISRLIVPADHAVLASAIAQATAEGRSTPVVIHLANPAREPSVLTALANGDSPLGLSVTLGRIPASLSAAAHGLRGVEAFRLEAAARLAAGAPASLALIEIAEQGATGRSAAAEAPEAAILGDLAAAIPRPASGAAPLVGSLTDGRYGVISDQPLDLGGVCERFDDLRRTAGRPASVHGTGLSLNTAGRTAGEMVRALGFALRCFATGGAGELAAMGFSRGLEGFLALAGERRDAMQRMIAGRRFRLAFQPVVGLADRTVRHYEALLRLMPDPGGRPPSTQEFVTFVEAAGLAEELDTAVLEEALAVLTEVPEAAVSVNMSGFSLQSEAFRTRLSKLLAHPAGRRGRLLVELTETAEIEDVRAAQRTLACLREAGIPVCLDDFGAGAAAFRYLREFRVDYIKIDGSFLRAARQSPRERATLASMVALARDVRAKVVVEMIENAEDEELSRALGAELGQGWLYGRPGRLPGSALRAPS